MSGKIKFLLVSLYIVGFALLMKSFTVGKNMGILDPKGILAREEKELIFIAIGLMLLVVLPVFIMTLTFAFRYRADNTHAAYRPNEDHNTLEEFIWWLIPCIIIFILAVITWKSSHELDPYRPLTSDKAPITIQVVALNWKWLFIYPEEGIATLGFVEIPEDTPINFQITSDAPMNSFWIPQLAGQVYAMAGMNTQLHVMADEPGVYPGMSSNFSGDGFTEMKFNVRSVSQNDYDSWLLGIQYARNTLNKETYAQLTKPSTQKGEQVYSIVEPNLYENILNKYMSPNTNEERKNNEIMDDMSMPQRIEIETTATSGEVIMQM